MNRKPVIYLVLFFSASALLMFQSCDNPADISQEHERWSSADPLSVSLRARQQKFELGNLVHNPSFELGKVKQVDSLTQSIVIEGWNIVGQNIRWLKILSDSVSVDNPYIRSGNRSIRIVRTNASETDEIGSGVISDYIRVIPGNYNLSMYLNLIDIENPKSRLGTGIYDAIDIRIIYYDKNKISLSGKQFSPYHNLYFNNSFKGESLSRFDNIDSTGWIHVQGRSHLFPVPDGDIQDNAKYIRIFIGLKGNGTMLIDDINYAYTRWNFTQLERLEAYFDTTFSLSQLINPQPRFVKVMESIIYYRPYYKDIFPVVLIPKHPDVNTILAARYLEDHIRKTISELTNTTIDSIPELMTNSISERDLESTVTFSVGKTDLFRRKASSIPFLEIENKEQGFLLYTSDDDFNVIFLTGSSPDADFYAVQTAIQLFDNRRLLFHNANIIDYPANTVRSLLLNDMNGHNSGFLENSKVLRYNQIYLSATNANLEKTIDKINRYGINSIQLYTNLNSEAGRKIFGDRSISNLLLSDNSRVNGFAVINEVFAIEKSGEESTISILPYISELEKLAKAGIELEIQAKSSDISLFCTDYIERKQDKENTSENISFIWSGNGIHTWKLDEADYLRYKMNSAGKTIYMDLSLYPRDRISNYFLYDSLWPYKLACASLFEPYDNEIVPEVFENTEKTILAFKSDNLFDEIRLQTASDFLWNPDNYNPDLSLFRALITLYGVKSSKDLLYFNDHYFKARSNLILARTPKNYQKHIRKAETYIQEMKNLQNVLLSQEEVQQDKALIDMISNLLKEVELIKKGLEKSILNTE